MNIFLNKRKCKRTFYKSENRKKLNRNNTVFLLEIQSMSQ